MRAQCESRKNSPLYESWLHGDWSQPHIPIDKFEYFGDYGSKSIEQALQKLDKCDLGKIHMQDHQQASEEAKKTPHQQETLDRSTGKLPWPDAPAGTLDFVVSIGANSTGKGAKYKMLHERRQKREDEKKRQRKGDRHQEHQRDRTYEHTIHNDTSYYNHSERQHDVRSEWGGRTQSTWSTLAPAHHGYGCGWGHPLPPPPPTTDSGPWSWPARRTPNIPPAANKKHRYTRN